MGLAPNKESRQARRLGALELRLAGLPIRRIAERQGVSVSTCHNDLDVVLGDLVEQHTAGAAKLRAVQSARYESLLEPIWSTAKGGDLPAIDRCVALLTRLDKINGIDNSESISMLVNQQVTQINVQPAVRVEQLAEYAKIIRNLVAKDDPVEAEPLATNGHRECFSV